VTAHAWCTGTWRGRFKRTRKKKKQPKKKKTPTGHFLFYVLYVVL
jgi:hypothetical protein